MLWSKNAGVSWCFCFICLHLLFLLYDSTISDLNFNAGNRARSKHRTGTWRVITVPLFSDFCEGDWMQLKCQWGLKAYISIYIYIYISVIFKIACNDKQWRKTQQTHNTLTHTHMIIIFITFIDMMCEPNMLSFSKLKRLGSIFQVTWPAEKFARKEPGLAGKPGK